jgi:peptidyl-prolyl cis-trans isomerase B (cyclophilin B)
MAKKKKNANYVTEKTVAAKAEKLRAEKKKKKGKIVKACLITLAVILAIAGIIIALCFAFGAFEYSPEATYDASIEIQGYGAIHVELYGKDAPITVQNFISRANSGYYNGKTFHTLAEDLLYGGSVYSESNTLGIKGEFSENGVENKISHIRGTLSMARGEGPNTAYGQFFIVRKNSRELDGKYAAFGRITDGMDIIDKIFKDVKLDENGKIDPSTPIVITRVSTHAAHSH